MYHRMKNDQPDSAHFQKLDVTLLLAEPKGLVFLQAFCFKLKTLPDQNQLNLKALGACREFYIADAAPHLKSDRQYFISK